MGASALLMASIINHLTLMTLLLQLGAEVVIRESQGITAKCMLFCDENTIGDVSDRVRLLLSWGTNFFSDRKGSREYCIFNATIGKMVNTNSPISSSLTLGEGGARSTI